MGLRFRGDDRGHGRVDQGGINENLVQRGLLRQEFRVPFAIRSKCEFGFYRKGLCWDLDLELAVRAGRVYNPARRCFR